MLNWEHVSAFIDSETEWVNFPFELQFLEFGDRIYASHVGSFAWAAFVHGLPEVGNPAGEQDFRQGWHYTRNATCELAVRRAVESRAYARPHERPAWITVDSLPSILYGVAINSRFVEEVILSRDYPRPRTCVDAVMTTLHAWDTTPRPWIPTVLTLEKVPCVIV